MALMAKKMFNKNYVVPFFLLLFSIPAIYYLLHSGFYEPHDLHHFADIYQMVRAFSSGQIPPRLGPDFTFGYGYPLFNFYYVMPFYLGALLYFIFGSITLSFKLVFVISVLLSLAGMYLFLREFFGKYASFIGSIIFLYTPYRALQIYVRGAMGEALTLSLLPLLGWVIVKIVKSDGKLRTVGWASIICAVFLLSHNYMWALSLPWVLLLAIFLVKKGTVGINFSKLLLLGTLAVGMTIYWWLPGLAEQKLVNPSTPFPLFDHFPFIKQLIIPFWGYGASVWGPGDGLSFQIGITNIAVVCATLFLIVFYRKFYLKKDNLKLTIWALAGFVTSFVFMNVRSYPIWKLLPFYNLIQFPWRLLFLTTFFTSILAGNLVELLEGRVRKIIGVGLLILSILTTYQYFQPSKVFYKSDDEYLARFFANRTVNGDKDSVSGEYLNYSEDYLLLTNWTKEKPMTLPQSKITSAEAKITNIKEISPVDWKADVSANESGVVTFNSYYFPGWFARIDGRDAQINPGGPFGQIELVVSEGRHSIEFYWAETPLRKAADLVSVFSLFAALLLVFSRKR